MPTGCAQYRMHSSEALVKRSHPGSDVFHAIPQLIGALLTPTA
jgi:hypothetical protein